MKKNGLLTDGVNDKLIHRRALLVFILHKSLAKEGSSVTSMVLILDGISKIGAYVRSNLCYLICLRLLIRPRFLSSEKT